MPRGSPKTRYFVTLGECRVAARMTSAPIDPNGGTRDMGNGSGMFGDLRRTLEYAVDRHAYKKASLDAPNALMACKLGSPFAELLCMLSEIKRKGVQLRQKAQNRDDLIDAYVVSTQAQYRLAAAEGGIVSYCRWREAVTTFLVP